MSIKTATTLTVDGTFISPGSRSGKTDQKQKEDIVNALEELAHASVDSGKLEEANGYVQQLAPLVSASGNRLDALVVTFAQARIAAASHHNEDAEGLFRVVEKDPGSQASMRLGAEHELARLYESEGDAVAADQMPRRR